VREAEARIVPAAGAGRGSRGCLPGVTALQSAGIEVDPQNQRLKKLPAVRLKGLKGFR
jgi:hypothetical protein